MTEDIASKVNRLSSDIQELKRSPNQAVIDKTMALLVSKLDDRDKIIDLELRNLSKSIQLDIQKTLDVSFSNFESRIDKKLKEVVREQKDKVSWGIEVVRFTVVVIMFILSIKLVK